MEKKYKKLLMAAAKYEVSILKKSPVKFKLSKEKFNPQQHDNCFYGQHFGSSSCVEAKDFKTQNGILWGFSTNRTMNGDNASGLEMLLYNMWLQGKKEEVFRIVEQFATWTDAEVKKPKVSYNLD